MFLIHAGVVGDTLLVAVDMAHVFFLAIAYMALAAGAVYLANRPQPSPHWG